MPTATASVDAGELQSLAEAGITSIGLVSDGIAYSRPTATSQVAGTATYTNADGSTGDAADAIFRDRRSKPAGASGCGQQQHGDACGGGCRGRHGG